MSDGTVIVFARAPRLGSVKTRLVSLLGPRHTLDLYRALLGDTLTAAGLADATVVLAHTAGPAFAEQSLASYCLVQPRGDFGKRMDAALHEVYHRQRSDEPYLIVGADAPHVSPGTLRRAIKALRRNDAALGRCQAGGFYLLGFSGPPLAVRSAFRTPPEDEAVLSILRKAGKSVYHAERSFDIDRPRDLVRFVGTLEKLRAVDSGWLPPRCEALMQRWAEAGIPGQWGGSSDPASGGDPTYEPLTGSRWPAGAQVNR